MESASSTHALTMSWLALQTHWTQKPTAAEYHHPPTDITAFSEAMGSYADELMCSTTYKAGSLRLLDDAHDAMNQKKLRKMWDGSGAVTSNIPQPSSRYGNDDWRTELAGFLDLRLFQAIQAKVMADELQFH